MIIVHSKIRYLQLLFDFYTSTTPYSIIYVWWYVGESTYFAHTYNTCVYCTLHTCRTPYDFNDQLSDGERRKNHNRLVELAHGIISRICT